MDRFSKAAIIVTILVILSNAVLIYFDALYYQKSTSLLFNAITFKVINIVLFTAIIILKLVFKKAVNYLFYCFFTSIFIISALSIIGFFIQDCFNKLTPSQNLFKANIWLPISCDILWLFMFILLYFNLKIVQKDESNYFVKKDQLNEKLKLFKHGLIFWLFILLMLVNLFFIVLLGDITDLFASSSGFSSLIFLLSCCITLVAIFKQLFSFYIFFVCTIIYLILHLILPTLVNFFLTGSAMPLSQKIVLLSVQLISMSAIVIVSLQANLHYRKIKYKEDAI